MTLSFTCGEGKNCSTIKKSQNIMNMIADPFIYKSPSFYRTPAFTEHLRWLLFLKKNTTLCDLRIHHFSDFHWKNTKKVSSSFKSAYFKNFFPSHDFNTSSFERYKCLTSFSIKYYGYYSFDLNLEQPLQIRDKNKTIFR